MDNYSAKLLGLKEAVVTKVENFEKELHVHITLLRKSHTCPCCGTPTDRIHDYRIQKVKDAPAFGKDVILFLRKRRYVCPECGKRFYEQNLFLPRYYRSTQRKIVQVIHSFQEAVSATHIAKEHHISVSTALRYFDLISYGTYKLPRVISLDEFKGNAGGEKFQTTLVLRGVAVFPVGGGNFYNARCNCTTSPTSRRHYPATSSSENYIDECKLLDCSAPFYIANCNCLPLRLFSKYSLFTLINCILLNKITILLELQKPETIGNTSFLLIEFYSCAELSRKLQIVAGKTE